MTPSVKITTVDALDLAFEEEPWVFATERAAEIDANWQRLSTANPALFNGPVLLLREGGITTELDGRRVYRATFFRTEFKVLLGFQTLDAADPTVRNGFAMAALRTDDGAFLVGEMAAHTAIAGQVQFPAGTPDLSDISGAIIDLEASALRELGEETGLRPDQVFVVPGWTLVSVGPRIAFMKEMRIAASASAAIAHINQFLADEAVPEFSRVVAVHDPADLAGLNLPMFMRAYFDAQWGAVATVSCGELAISDRGT